MYTHPHVGRWLGLLMHPYGFPAGELLPSGYDDIAVVWVKLHHVALTPELLACNHGRSRSSENVEYGLPW